MKRQNILRLRDGHASSRHGTASRPGGRLARVWLTGLFALLLAFDSMAQLLRLTDLTSTQIEKLDRAKTVVLMPGGVLEQHGPYLPVFADGFMNAWWTERLGETLAREGWTVVEFPMLPLGDGGANEIGRKYNFPGSYGVRVATLRAVYMDLATELGEQGFRWIFVLQNHGSPVHNLTLDQAGDYFHDSFGGQMVNLTGLEPTGGTPPPALGEEARQVNGIDIHAGLSESSRIQFLHPGLVNPAIAQAPPFTARAPADLAAIARRPDWTGYFGAPHLASPAYGAQLMEWRLAHYTQLAREILAGKDPRSIPRYSTEAMKREKPIMDDSLAYDERVRSRQAAWLKKHGIE
jgi:creatinine amidohydrolase/Fe(II)-dependent formamide hydrolase-like protein